MATLVFEFYMAWPDREVSDSTAVWVLSSLARARRGGNTAVWVLGGLVIARRGGNTAVWVLSVWAPSDK